MKAIGEPVHLVAHSHGGSVTLVTAISARIPIRSLTLFEPLPLTVLVGRDDLRDEMRAFLQDYSAAWEAGDHMAQWDGMALEMSRIVPCVVPDHEHPTHVLHLIAEGMARSTAIVGGRTFSDPRIPGTVMLVPRGTRDRTVFHDYFTIISLALHPQLITRAASETEREIELRFEWSLSDRQIQSVLFALQADVKDGSPAGRLFGESLGVALAVYLARRYAADPVSPARVRGGLPTYRLRRVLDYIAAHLERDLSLGDLAGVAGLSPHYFAELFRQRLGKTPHRYVLECRIEHAKQLMRNRTRTMLEVALLSGFKDQSHFGRVFRQLVGTPPSTYRAGL